VLCAASRQDLESTAFVNPDGAAVVVVMNRTEEAIGLRLQVGDQTTSTELPARSIATYLLAA
jgi:glucosylceramidase